MDIDKIRRIILQAYRELSPALCDVSLTAGEGSYLVVLATVEFEGLSTKRRFDLAWKLLSEHAPEFLDQSLVSFELWSPREFKDLQTHGKFQGLELTSDSDFNKVAKSVDA